MELFKWAVDLKPKFPRFIENLFGSKITDSANAGESVSSVPAVNVESGDSRYQLEIAVPGMDRDDIKVEVDGNVLTVSSEKQYSNEYRGKHFVRQEFSYAAFSRSFAIPDDVDPEKVTAKMDNGILKVSVPTSKSVERNVKQIKVK